MTRKNQLIALGFALSLAFGAALGEIHAQAFHAIKNSTEPVFEAAAVTPNDSTDLPEQCRALYVGGNGNIRLDLPGAGTNVLFSAAKGGSVLPFRVARVRSTGTTANNLVCLY